MQPDFQNQLQNQQEMQFNQNEQQNSLFTAENSMNSLFPLSLPFLTFQNPQADVLTLNQPLQFTPQQPLLINTLNHSTFSKEPSPLPVVVQPAPTLNSAVAAFVQSNVLTNTIVQEIANAVTVAVQQNQISLQIENEIQKSQQQLQMHQIQHESLIQKEQCVLQENIIAQQQIQINQQQHQMEALMDAIDPEIVEEIINKDDTETIYLPTIPVEIAQSPEQTIAEPESTFDFDITLLESEINVSSFGLLNKVNENSSIDFEKSVNALYNICHFKLFRSSFKTQALYGEQRWGIKSGRLCQLLSCRNVLLALKDCDRRPFSEKICRTLSFSCKNSPIDIKTLWESCLAENIDYSKVSSSFIKQKFQELTTNKRKSEAPIPILHYTIPQDLDEKITLFFNGSIEVNPLWVSGMNEPELVLEDSLNQDWICHSLFLPLLGGFESYDYAQDWFTKFMIEVETSHVDEALLIVKYDLSIDWIRTAIEKFSCVLLFPILFPATPEGKKRKISGKKEGLVSHVLLYYGNSDSRFYDHFKDLGVCPNIKTMASSATGI